MPNTIARKSMPNTLMITEWPRRKRKPSTTDDTALVVLETKETPLLILGLILLLLGFLLKISILWTIGIILLLVGAVLFSLIGYVLVRTKLPGRAALDSIAAKDVTVQDFGGAGKQEYIIRMLESDRQPQQILRCAGDFAFA